MKDGDHRRLLALFVFLTLVPVFAARYLPLVDLPGHVGRIHVLDRLLTGAGFEQYYVTVARPLPNLGMDAILLACYKFLPMTEALRVYVVLGMLAFAAGCALLSRAFHGRITWLAAIAPVAQHNSMFNYGFVSYNFGVGMFLIAFALWYRWRTAWTPSRLAAIALLSFAVYFTHLTGLAFLLAAAGMVALSDCVRQKRLGWRQIRDVGVLMAPLAMYLATRETGGDIPATDWGTWRLKALHAYALLRGFDIRFDVAAGAALALASLAALDRKTLQIHRDAIVAGASFWAFFAIFPTGALTGSDADTRFTLPAAVLTLLAISGRPSARWARIAQVLAVATMVGRIGVTAWAWRGESAAIAGQIEMFGKMERWSRVFPIVVTEAEADESKFERPISTAIGWAVSERDAYVPTTFAVTGQHPLRRRKGTPYTYQQIGENYPIMRMLDDYDYVWYFGPHGKLPREVGERGERSAVEGMGSLWRIRRN